MTSIYGTYENYKHCFSYVLFKTKTSKYLLFEDYLMYAHLYDLFMIIIILKLKLNFFETNAINYLINA